MIAAWSTVFLGTIDDPAQVAVAPLRRPRRKRAPCRILLLECCEGTWALPTFTENEYALPVVKIVVCISATLSEFEIFFDELQDVLHMGELRVLGHIDNRRLHFGDF